MTPIKALLRRRALVACAVVVGLVVGLGCSRGGVPTTTTLGNLSVVGTLDPDPPRLQGNSLVLDLVDAAGNPVEGANISVTSLMPAVGAMAQMRGTAKIEADGGGRYRAAFDLQKSGTWTLVVDVHAGAGSGTVQFRLTVGTQGLSAIAGTAAAASTSSSAPAAATDVSPEALAKLVGVFSAYESMRALLARDTIVGIAEPARSAAAGLREAAAFAGPASTDVMGWLESAAHEADLVAAVGNIRAARAAFGELSRSLTALASADARLQAGWHVFECPMAEGFKRWFQRSPQLQNPYMGQKMLRCGSTSPWASAVASAAAATAITPGNEDAPHAHGGDDIAHFTCSMHPSVKSKTPGTCPICNMTLTPVTQHEIDTGILVVDEGRRQQIGVKTSRVQMRPLRLDIHTVARITYDETRLHEVNLRIGGWVERLFVDRPGQAVKAGQTLFTLYSPELYAAQLEFLAAHRASTDATDDGGAGISATLERSARKRLELLNLTAQQIDALSVSGEPVKNMPILSPADGYIIEKHVIAGSKIEPGQPVYRIADLQRVWIEADLFEADLPRVTVGMAAKITLPYLAGLQYEGRVSFIYPYLDDATRTGRIRIELANPHLELKPNMYANVEIGAVLADALQIPSEAVIYTGRRRLVFVDLGAGRLRPQEIQVGREGRELTEVLQGLNADDIVVTSGNFLIAAESRIRSATNFWSRDETFGPAPTSARPTPSSMPTSIPPAMPVEKRGTP